MQHRGMRSSPLHARFCVALLLVGCASHRRAPGDSGADADADEALVDASVGPSDLDSSVSDASVPTPPVCASDAWGRPRLVRVGPYSLGDSRHIEIPGGSTTETRVGDVTGDGRADIVAVGGVNTVLLEQETAGGLELHLEVGPPAVVIALGDLDGDSVLDVVLSEAWSRLTVLRGGGTLDERSHVDVAHLGRVRMADVDLDGSLDVVTINRAESQIVLLTGTGDGELRAPELASGPAVAQLATFDLIDADRDAHPDVVGMCVGPEAASVCVFRFADERRAFDPTPATRVGSWPALRVGIAAGDFDGDGLGEVVASIWEGAWTDTWWLGDAPTGLSEPVQLWARRATDGVVAGDVSGDGYDDVLLVHDRDVEVLLSDGVGPTTATAYRTPSATTVHTSFSVGDVNCDGCPDVVGADSTGVVVFYGSCG